MATPEQIMELARQGFSPEDINLFKRELKPWVPVGYWDGSEVRGPNGPVSPEEAERTYARMRQEQLESSPAMMRYYFGPDAVDSPASFEESMNGLRGTLSQVDEILGLGYDERPMAQKTFPPSGPPSQMPVYPPSGSPTAQFQSGVNQRNSSEDLMRLLDQRLSRQRARPAR